MATFKSGLREIPHRVDSHRRSEMPAHGNKENVKDKLTSMTTVRRIGHWSVGTKREMYHRQ